MAIKTIFNYNKKLQERYKRLKEFDFDKWRMLSLHIDMTVFLAEMNSIAFNRFGMIIDYIVNHTSKNCKGAR